MEAPYTLNSPPVVSFNPLQKSREPLPGIAHVKLSRKICTKFHSSAAGAVVILANQAPRFSTKGWGKGLGFECLTGLNRRRLEPETL